MNIIARLLFVKRFFRGMAFFGGNGDAFSLKQTHSCKPHNYNELLIPLCRVQG
jgi:hypothetical protein